MMVRHAPIAKPVFLCDEIVRDNSSRKFSFLNTFDYLRVPKGEEFPFPLAKMCVFAELTDGFGEFRFRVDVARLDNWDIIIRSTERVARFDDRLANVGVIFRLLNCKFPAAGHYVVQLFCDDDMIGDRVLHVKGD